MEVDTWTKCYPSQWKNMIVPDAIAHPAKFSSKLIHKIYEHLLEEGWVKPGDVVIDPFGGVGLGALDAMRIGLCWRGVELEPRFVDLGNANIEFWNAKFHALPRWSGDALLLQGDSRELVRVLSGNGQASVSSPPYSESEITQRTNFYSPDNPSGQKANKPQDERKNGYLASISSPPFADKTADGGWQMFDKYAKEGKLTVKQVNGDPNKSYPSWSEERDTSYGESPGQLGQMKSTSEGFQASISSPPFLQSEGGTPEPKPGGVIDEALYKRHQAGNAAAQGYGESDANLGNMRGSQEGFQASISSPPYADGAQHTGGDDAHPEHIKGGKIHLPGIVGAVSSPPYAESLGRGTVDANERRKFAREQGISNAEHVSPIDMKKIGKREQDYGSTPGQLGAMPARVDSFNASVSSPPYEHQELDYGNRPNRAAKLVDNSNFKGRTHWINNDKTNTHYGETEGQLSGSGSDFWTAARQIVEQTYLALAPGAHAVWVVKDFVKNKERVPFCEQWRQLCEAVGFVTLHEHRALLTNHKGKQNTLENGTLELKTESKSFFRRLAEKKAAARNYWQTLETAVREIFLEQAERTKWEEYNKNIQKSPKLKKPSKSSILQSAQMLALESSNENPDDWNQSTRIDWETVYCMERPA